MPEWIPVTERLPNIQEDVLWFHPEDNECVMGYLNDSRDYPGTLLVRQCRGYESDPAIFSHWMPLPPPPGQKLETVTA
jgi:hypothetical protein